MRYYYESLEKEFSPVFFGKKSISGKKGWYKKAHFIQFTKQVFAQVSGELRREWFPEDDETGLVQESNQTSSSTKTNKTGFKNDDGGSRVTRDRPYTAFNRFPV